MSDTPPELPAAKREIGRLRAENFALKRSLAERDWEDMNHYADAKGALIREIRARAGGGTASG